MFATIYVLCYGDYVALHERALDSLNRALPAGEDVNVVVWCNQLSPRAKKAIDHMVGHFAGGSSWHLYPSTENTPKYQAMRELWWHAHEYFRPQGQWTLWLDDDTYITEKDWWKKTKLFLQHDPSVCYVGQKWYVHHQPGQWDFIKAAPWFKGKSPELLPTKKRGVTKPGIWFMTGGYVWLRTDVMRGLDWPDVRLNHNGGDTLLGEAIRQQGLPRHHFDYGVAVNKAKRRGLSERPAGSKKNTRR